MLGGKEGGSGVLKVSIAVVCLRHVRYLSFSKLSLFSVSLFQVDLGISDILFQENHLYTARKWGREGPTAGAERASLSRFLTFFMLMK